MTEQHLVRHSLQDNILDQVGQDENSATNEIFTSILQQTPQTELPQFGNQYYKSNFCRQTFCCTKLFWDQDLFFPNINSQKCWPKGFIDPRGENPFFVLCRFGCWQISMASASVRVTSRQKWCRDRCSQGNPQKNARVGPGLIVINEVLTPYTHEFLSP